MFGTELAEHAWGPSRKCFCCLFVLFWRRASSFSAFVCMRQTHKCFDLIILQLISFGFLCCCCCFFLWCIVGPILKRSNYQCTRQSRTVIEILRSVNELNWFQQWDCHIKSICPIFKMLQAMNVGFVLTDVLSLSISNVLKSILLLRILSAELYYFILWILMHVVTFLCFLFDTIHSIILWKCFSRPQLYVFSMNIL